MYKLKFKWPSHFICYQWRNINLSDSLFLQKMGQNNKCSAWGVMRPIVPNDDRKCDHSTLITTVVFPILHSRHLCGYLLSWMWYPRPAIAHHCYQSPAHMYRSSSFTVLTAILFMLHLYSDRNRSNPLTCLFMKKPAWMMLVTHLRPCTNNSS